MLELSGRGFLATLRLSDSALPTGLFTQSHGLETFVQSGRVRLPDDVSRVLADILRDQIGTTDSIAVASSWRAAATDNLEKILEVDRTLHATKLTRETREGSQRSGGRLLHLGQELTRSPLLASLQAKVKDRQTPGHYAPVFGALSAKMSIPLKAAVQMELYSFASSFLGAAMRLVRFDHMDSQRTLAALEPLILEIADRSCGKDLTEMRSFSPLGEIMSMHHERGRVRLFSS